jgi:hypothetical protein
MQKFHLDLERSNFKSNNIKELEPLLAEWLKSEGETNFNKTKTVSPKELSEEQQLEMYLDNIGDKFYYENEEVENIHYYNEWTYIIETI